jgi:PAS domain S-box-containing protein
MRDWLGIKFPVPNGSGPRLIGGIGMDVTEQQRAASALRDSEAQLRLIADELPAIATVTDAALCYTSVVGAGLRSIGVTPDRLLGRNVEEVLGAVDPEPALLAAFRRARSGESQTVEHEWNGRTFQARIEPLYGADEKITGTVAVFVDETERKRALRERSESAARTRVLARVSRACDAAGLDVRAVAETTTRVISDTMHDGCTLSLLSPDGRVFRAVAIHHRDPDARALVQRLLAEAPWPVEEELFAGMIAQAKPLRLWFGEPNAFRDLVGPSYWPYLDRFTVYGLLVVPLRVDGRTIGMLAVWRDRIEHEYSVDDEVLLQELADRAALAIANARLYEELEQRVRERTLELEAANRELEAFSYSVSHDLRAPLRSVIGFASVLRDDHGAVLDADGRHTLERVLAGGRRMEALIEALLSLSRTGRADLYRAPVALSELVHQVGDELQRAHPDRTVTLRVAPDVIVDADERLLRVVMANLLGNAWKYTARRDEAHVEFGLGHHDGEPVFYVRDDGAGFDMRYADKLFGPFQRLHSATEFSGSGIGLATVQRIIHRHGGRIWAEAAVDEGATFYFTLP